MSNGETCIADVSGSREQHGCPSASQQAGGGQPVADLVFDGDNSYPGCEQCGKCCRINVICLSHEEYRTIRAFMAEHDVKPIDYGKERCCFQQADGHCGIWDARPQICRLYNCHVPRIEVLKANPSIVVDDDKPLIDLHDAFILNDPYDPRTRVQNASER